MAKHESHIGGVDMSRRIKTVALDDQSAKIAESLPNFSHFVRECLFRHAVHHTAECLRERNFETTNRAIREYRSSLDTKQPLDIRFLDEQARIKNTYLFDVRGIQKVPKLRSDPPLKPSLWQKLRQKFK
jgi:hypothetical protein